VYAEIHHGDPGGFDDDVFVPLSHTGGAHSHLWGSSVQSASGPRFRVTGTSATYLVEGMDIQEELLLAGRTPASEGDSWEPNRRTGGADRTATPESCPSQPSAAAGTPTARPSPPPTAGTDPYPYPSTQDAVTTAQVLDTARRSAAHKQLIDLPPA
jgi:hypothetical protein